jgi:hypothetical protein
MNDCTRNCADCKKPVSLTDISYVGYDFHRRCFIRRISKHCGEAKRQEIFENHGITAEELEMYGVQLQVASASR